MFKISITRLAAAAIVGLSVAVTAGAAHAEGDLDRLFEKPASRDNNGLPGFEQPRLDPRRVFIGTWSVKLRKGGHIAVRFNPNGTYFLINNSQPNRIEVGRWSVRNGNRLVLVPAGTCARNNMKDCKRYSNRKPILVSFRIVNRNRVDAPAGVFTRHS